jgi:hypothetical protein
MKRKFLLISALFICFLLFTGASSKTYAQSSCGTACNCPCKAGIDFNHTDDKKGIRPHVTREFKNHQIWFIDTFFSEHIQPALALMTTQLSALSMQQTKIIGTFFDAKHQLETQRAFQKLMAEAHKDYQPSEGLCEIGTNIRSLAASEKNTDLTQEVFSARIMARQTLNSDTVAAAGPESDLLSRVDLFRTTHCRSEDNDDGLGYLCDAKNGSNITYKPERHNKDSDFTRTLESQLTLDIDFSGAALSSASPDAQDIFALTANLYGHTPPPIIPARILATKEGLPREAATDYMNLRSIMAKRSVAQNSMTALTALRTSGDPEVARYLKKIVTELGIADNEVEDILGENPSYFAQMEVLTKDLYQNPTFYTELYDKPANVTRKGTTLKAIGLMQDRDFFESQLRSEAVLAIILEQMLNSENDRVSSELLNLRPGGKAAP